MVGPRRIGSVMAAFVAGGAPVLGLGSAAGAAPYPPANVPEDLPTSAYCHVRPDNGPACSAAQLHDINVARQTLGLGPMVLPVDFATLPAPEQELIVTNWERQPYGLAPFPSLDTRLNPAASAVDPAGPLADPVLPSGYLATRWQSIVAAGSPNVLGGTTSGCTTTALAGPIGNALWPRRRGAGATARPS